MNSSTLTAAYAPSPSMALMIKCPSLPSSSSFTVLYRPYLQTSRVTLLLSKSHSDRQPKCSGDWFRMSLNEGVSRVSDSGSGSGSGRQTFRLMDAPSLIRLVIVLQ